MNCTRCDLYKYKSNYVPGRGIIPADILLMGEAPGIAEDTLGEAFVGISGKLLDCMLWDALSKSELKEFPSYYITNTVLCHPCDKKGGENRKPTKEEVARCMYNVSKIIEKVNASQIILIGKEAEKYYGKIFNNYFTINHPAYLLRGGGVKHPYYGKNVRILTNVFNTL